MLWYDIILVFFIIIFSIIFQLHYLEMSQTKNKTYNAYALYIPERFTHLRSEINKTNLPVQYILGFDKNKIDLNTIINNKQNPGKIVCHLGHLSIMQQFLQTDKDYAIIFEDDIYFKDHNMIKPKIDYIVNTAPHDADIIFLSYCLEDCSEMNNDQIFNRAKQAMCRHAYIVSRKGASILIKNTWPMDSIGGDNMYANLLISNKLSGYTINPKFLFIEQNRLKFGSKLANFNYASGVAPNRCIT